MKTRKSKFNYRVGDVVADWTIIGEEQIDRHGHRKHLCRCVCGNESTVAASNLMGGKSTKCLKCVGRINAENRKAKNDLTGQVFGNLTVLGRSHKSVFKSQPHGTWFWKCLCTCGNESYPSHSNLVAGKSRSCGHCGATSGEAHGCWQGYGEIGINRWNQIIRAAKVRSIDFLITIEEAWNLFLKQNRKCALTGWPLVMHVPGDMPAATASLDRINPNGDYSLDNVQWVHKDVNTSKWDYEQDYYIKMCIAVAEKYAAPYRQF